MTNNSYNGSRLWQTLKYCFNNEISVGSQLLFAALIILWAASFSSAKWLLQSTLLDSELMRWLVVATPTILGLITVMSYLNFLHKADEFIRKIQLEAVALGFAAGVLFNTGQALLQELNIIEVSTGSTATIMLIVFALGQFYAAWRYR